MNELTKYQTRLPATYQRQLAKQTSQMDFIARLTVDALGAQSNIHSYTVFEVFKTLATISALKQAFPTSSMNPETEAILNALTQDYLQAMQRIPQEACRRILQVLENASASPDDGGILETIIDAFFDRTNE
jgi:hypothetical protein